MKLAIRTMAWALTAAVIAYAAAHPEHGVIHHSPLATLGVGLIGLGLCLEARQAARRRA